MSEFQELSDQTMLDRFKHHDSWLLEDIVLLVFGYEYEGQKWDVTNSNVYPIRNYNTALQATNSMKPSARLDFISKENSKPDYTRCFVKKGPFIKWAFKQWGDVEPRVQRTYKLWQKYKSQTATTATSLETTEAKVKNYADKIQIEQFLAHTKLNNGKKYKANISEIARQIKLTQKNIDGRESTFKRYIDRMSATELAKHLP